MKIVDKCCGSCELFEHEDMCGVGQCAETKEERECDDKPCKHWEIAAYLLKQD
jgi:hypothetical protein